MTRYLIGATAAVLLSASPLLAADTSNPTNPPTGANAAGADTSSGAKEQSSAPPGSPAESDLSTKSSEGASGDTSSGAKEQSSAPPGSSAANPSQPNPTPNTSTAKPGQGANAGSADTSSGAKEQSSAPSGSGAGTDPSTKSSEGTSGDTSSGAKEQSSAPPSSAASSSKGNPTSNTSQPY